MGGRCVRLTKGVFDASISYGDDPVEMATSFESQGVKRLHVVDLDGARTGSPSHHETLRGIKERTQLTVDFGGGIRSGEAVTAAFEAGADQLSVGSVAVTQPDLLGEWIESYGSDRFIFAADARDGNVAISGWAEATSISLASAIERAIDVGVTSALVTDIKVDGTLAGPAIDLYRQLRVRFPNLYLIASGGVGSEDDIRALEPTGVDAVIVGKAIYEGRIRLSEFV